MRVGNNPNRNNRTSAFEPVIFAVITHLPHTEGYHAQRLKVIKTCLTSMTEHAGMKYSLAIWDNGSCNELKTWIKDTLHPAVFVDSVNAGKTTGRTSLMRMFPPDKIICYCDDDIYFYPNWLKPQIALLEHYPGVACVTGYPVRTSFRWGNEHTLAWARANAKLEVGRFIPDPWEDDFADSIGRDVQAHKNMTATDKDYKITYRGISAYATSHHCQFVGYAGTIGRVLTFDDFAMGDERPFDVALDSIGLRLATIDRYTRHIGNVIDEKLKQEIGV